MPCCDILIAYPIHSRDNVNKSYDRRIEHLRKHYSANQIGSYTTQGFKLLRIGLCDEDAANFLQDLPEPTFCVKISILRTGDILYANKKVTKEWVAPPQDKNLKQIYWSASQLEKWQPILTTSRT